MADSNDEQKRLTILFVDDEVENTTVMQRTLRRYHDVFVANSGSDALALLASQTFDVILADQRMPNMTGIEFLEKAKELAPEAYRVLLTGYADIQALIAGINRCGISRYLTKPWTKETLLEEIHRALEQKANPTADRLSPKAQYNILVVDDEETNLSLLKRALGRIHNVFLAHNGEEALEILQQHPIDVAIVDQRMPKMAGNTFLEQSERYNKDLIKIMITAYTDIDVIVDAINHAKVHKFLHKPFNPKDLPAIIDEFVGKS